MWCHIISGPLNIVRRWIGKFAVWIAYGTSAIIIINLINSADMAALVASPVEGMSFFSALDLVIAMPISWLPLVADYNRFARMSKSAGEFTYESVWSHYRQTIKGDVRPLCVHLS